MGKLCYECAKPHLELSKRNRCVACEYKRAEFNAKENDKLRDKLREELAQKSTKVTEKRVVYEARGWKGEGMASDNDLEHGW